MATVQRLCAVICIAFISSGLAEPLPKSGFNYREFFPDTSHRINRRDGMDDVMHVPDDTWEVEKNYTMTHPERRGVGIIRPPPRQVGSDQTPPSTACITIKAIYDSNWVQSSGGDGAAQVRAVLAEAQNIFMAKFATNNQLGTSIDFNFEEPTYDTQDTWQATGNDLDSNRVRKHVATNSHTTAHYAFFGGADSGGAIGIAYLGTTCERAPQDQKYKVSITEWYQSLADTAGVFAHELGHALGMDHDFTSSGGDRFDRNGVKCTDIDGVMDYGSRSSVDKWSTCSKQDYRDFYNRVLQTYNNEFCLTCENTNPTNPPATTENPPNPPESTEAPPEPPSSSGCDGTDRQNIRRCCRDNGPCNEGEGDCNRDRDCADGLRCGRNNCRRDFSTDQTVWGRRHDCCFYEVPEPTDDPTDPNGSGCDGTDRQNIRRCCRNNGPCNEGEGDCNRDSECADGLQCGRNNCRRDFSTDQTVWNRRHDCCFSDSIPTDGPTPPEPTDMPTNPPEPTDVPNPPNPTDGPTNPPEPTEEPTEGPTEEPQPTGGPSGSCGVKPAGIVGGSEVTPYSIPWQVALVSNGGNSPFCGGTLIGPRHVLTASHCINSNPTSNSFDIIVGEHKTSGSGSGSDGTRHEICRAVRHPQYNDGTLTNDFAIVHLREAVQIGTRAAPACLPGSNLGGNFLSGKTMTVSGWGTLSAGGSQPNVLHSVNVPGLTNSQCDSAYGGGITGAMLCAGNLQNGGVDSCQGDSGGPMTYTEGGKATVVGVVSWGIGCAQAGFPGVYARVTEALGFINEELGKSC